MTEASSPWQLAEASKTAEKVAEMRVEEKKEMDRNREQTKHASENYERELQLHAAARARLADVQGQVGGACPKPPHGHSHIDVIRLLTLCCAHGWPASVWYFGGAVDLCAGVGFGDD
jgi:hypothetical protein